MYRCTLCLCMLVLLAACSGKNVPVSRPSRANTAAHASEFEGLASYYAEPYHGRRTASGIRREAFELAGMGSGVRA